MNFCRMNRSIRWLFTSLLLLTMILTLAGPASVAQAASYVVTNLNDSGKGSLRQAILNANAGAGADTITFSLSGTILLSSTLPAITDVAGLSIDGTGRSITISGNDTVRVMSVNGGAAVTLRNLTVAGGYAAIGSGIYNAGTLSVRTSTFSGNSAYESFGPGGAGIANYGTLDVSNSTFSSNSAAVGGGIVNFGTVTVTDSTFSGNSGSGPDGGGGGGIANYGTLDVSNSTFSGNVGDNEGGGIFNNGTLSVTGSTFSGNGVGVFGTGGGIYNTSTLTVTNSTFSGNSASENGQGGGIFSQGTLNLTGSTFSGNTAGIGAGVFISSGTVTVSNSIFSGNIAETPDGGDAGGIYNGVSGTLTMTNSTFSDNTAFFEGGGIINHGMLSVMDSTFSGNRASSFSGIGGGIISYGTLDVANSTFWDNRSQEGGGIFNYGTATVTNSDLSGNSADNGGGISNHGTLDVTDGTFSGNQALSGGGVYNAVFGMLTVTDSTFSSNGNGIPGGGIYNAGTLEVTDSTFSDNSAEEGAGIYNQGTLNVTGSTFSGNSASEFGRGGGIANYGTLEVTNSTLSDNSAPLGGGIYNFATMTVTHGTFSGNSAPLGAGIFNDYTVTLQNTIVADSTGVNCTNNGSLIDGGGNLSWPDTTCPGLNADPLLGPLQDNGGPTQTHALLAGSAAIDAALLANCPATDQRGVSRPQGAGCDIGAYESGFESIAPAITINTPADGAVYVLGQVVTADYACQDEAGGSGLASCAGTVPNGSPIDTASVGAKTFTVDAADHAGNSASLTHHYSVVYSFSGFFQPVDNLPTFNVVQAGVGVPVRFSLSGDHGLAIFAAGYPISEQIACDSGAPQDAIEETVIVGASSLSYDAASDTYTYVWKTNKAWANTCRQLNIRLNDGSEHTANFKFVK